MAYRIGCDVGGTNTDTVVMKGRHVISAVKTPSSADALSGLMTSIRMAIETASVDLDKVGLCCIGTTRFVNACVQRKGLSKVAVLRLCGPATRDIAPFQDLPDDLRGLVGASSYFLDGGYEYDGGEEISPVREEEVRSVVREIFIGAGKGVVPESKVPEQVTSLVICGVFSPVNPQQEEAVRCIVLDELLRIEKETGGAFCQDEVHITLSHELATLGLLERENAAILNAALCPLARQIIPAFKQAVAAISSHLQVYYTSNDGTLVSEEMAEKFPVCTFQSGPVNSLRGAAFLSGLSDAIVLDIGGTSTDAGAIIHSLPRPAATNVVLSGVRMNLPMPDIRSIGLGGGSYVQRPAQGEEERTCAVGPDSVGNQLLVRALSQGGDVCTATDVAVLLGRVQLGSRDLVQKVLPHSDAHAAWRTTQELLEDILNQVKVTSEDVPVIVVGGASFLCGETLKGASEIVIPPHAEVANAVGAAIPQVSGVVDAVFELGTGEERRQKVLKEAEEMALQKAVQAGAQTLSCQVVEREVVPLAYLPGGIARVRIRVVGDLELQSAPISDLQIGLGSSEERETHFLSEAWKSSEEPLLLQEEKTEIVGSPRLGSGPSEARTAQVLWPSFESLKLQGECRAPEETPEGRTIPTEDWQVKPGEPAKTSEENVYDWKPEVNEKGEWIIREQDAYALATGCGILGTGGGGTPHNGLLKLLHLLRSGKLVRVISPVSVPEGAAVVDGGGMGAPTVSLEKIESLSSTIAAANALSKHLHGQLPWATIAAEIGGANGVEPLLMAAVLGVPAVDADYMGRAFPELQMCTPAIYGIPITPAALADEKGNVVLVEKSISPQWLEKITRPVCTAMGCSAGLSLAPLTGAQLREVAIPHSLSLAWHLGQEVHRARHNKTDPIEAVVRTAGGTLLFRGKVVDVSRSTSGGFARGRLLMKGLGPGWHDRDLEILFQNENLVAFVDGGLKASVPDLICCLETESGRAIQTEEIRFGLHATVVGLPAHPLLRTREALSVVGPSAFGYPQVAYKALGEYKHPVPIPFTR